jgi:hypothetical protein
MEDSLVALATAGTALKSITCSATVLEEWCPVSDDVETFYAGQSHRPPFRVKSLLKGF